MRCGVGRGDARSVVLTRLIVWNPCEISGILSRIPGELEPTNPSNYPEIRVQAWRVQVLVHPSHLCQIGAADQGHIAGNSINRCGQPTRALELALQPVFAHNAAVTNPVLDFTDAKLMQLLRGCIVSFGSLWWVDEQVWKERVGGYDKQSTKRGHPGVSLRRVPVRDSMEIVPLLHGTSGSAGPVVARGLSPDEDKGPNFPTSFGRLVIPAPLALDEMSGRSRVKPNNWKPRLNQAEMNALDAWDKRRRSNEIP